VKIVTYLLAALLVACLGGGAFFYLQIHAPMAEEHERLKIGQPELDKARRDLKRYQEREQQETAWTGPVAESFRRELNPEIVAGAAEVAVAGNQVIVNIAEPALYLRQSVTFARESQPLQLKLAALLKELKDKEIIVLNTTLPVPASGKGRRRVPARDARALATQRSYELVKALVRNGVPEDVLVSAAAAARLPERGLRIKDQKTMIIISAPPAVVAAPAPAAPKQEARTAPASTAAAPAAAGQQKPLPISPTPPPKVP
jgi:hypothetical protein